MIYQDWKDNCLNSGISNQNLNLKDCLFNQIIKDIDSTNKSLLLVGSVQSGKTATYMGLTAKLFDLNKSNLVVLFCGVTNKLKSQTIDRFAEAFKKTQDVEIFESKPKYYNYDNATESLKQGKKVLLISIKHHKHIEKIAEWANDNAELINNMLVIDDEGDQASFNNLAKFEATGKNSSTYDSFTTFNKTPNSFTFLSVTATPYAHVLVNKKKTIFNTSYVYMIPEGETYLSFNDLQKKKEIFHLLTESDVEELVIEKDEEGKKQLIDIPFSTKAALIQYFINHMRMFYELKQKKFSSQMIINIDRFIRSHFKIAELLQEFIDDFQSSDDLQNEVIDYLYPNETIDNKNRFRSYALEIINYVDFELRPVNCANDLEKDRDIEDKYNDKQCNVIIGCITIARGLSFPTLLSFYYLNDKTKTYTIDNIIQVCRFLGYRMNQINYFSIWFSKKIKSLLSSIFSADDWLRDKMSYYQQYHVPFENFARAIKISVALDANYRIRGTRQTVALQKLINRCNTLFNDAKFDFTDDGKYEIINDQMISFLDLCIKKYVNQKEKLTSSIYGNNFGNYPIIEFSKFSALLDYLKENGISEPLKLFKNYFMDSSQNAELLSILNKKNFKVIVALMLYDFDSNNGTYVSRSIAYNSELKEYSYYRQGFRADYVGDNSWSYEVKKNYDQDIIFIQLFSLNVPKKYEPIFKNKVIKMQVQVPVYMNNMFNEKLIIAKDECIGKVEKDIGFSDDK